MTAWSAWMGGLGDKLVEGRDPFGEQAFLGGATDSGINGYSIVDAADLEDTKSLAANHPHLGAGGAIEIAQFMQV